MIVVVMGVSGSGKSSIGTRLAKSLGWEFRDADAYHSDENIAKMSQGLPLDDADREPWLKAMRAAIEQWMREGRHVVLACSALKDKYREVLKENDTEDILFVYLKGDFEVLKRRMTGRKGHFMKVDLLASQFAALEEPSPDEALIINASLPFANVLAIAVKGVRARISSTSV